MAKTGANNAAGKTAGRTRSASNASTFASVALLAGVQALGILTEPGATRGSFDESFINQASETKPYSVLAGTNRVVPNLIWYGDFATKKVKNDVAIADMLLSAGLDGVAGYVAGGGTFGLAPDPPTAFIGLAEGTISGAIVSGLGALRTASYRYYAGWAYDFSHGPIDAVTEIFVDERRVYAGSNNAGSSVLIDDPQAWGGDHVDGGVYAVADIIAGNLWPIQQPNPYLKSLLGHVPAFSGKPVVVLRGPSGAEESGFFAAAPQGNPTVRPISFTVLRLPNLLGVPEFKAINSGKDANIIEVAYDWLTARTRGYGYGGKVALDKFSMSNLQGCAETIYNEGLGYSGELKDNISVQAALEDMCSFASMAVFEKPSTGEITFKLIRRDYSIPSLTVFDESNIESVQGYTQGTYGETPNEIRLEFPDRDNNYKPRALIAQNDAIQTLVGDTISKTVSFPGVGCQATGKIIIARELSAAAPRPPVKLIVNSDADDVDYGDVVKWAYAKYGIAQKVLRVVGIKRSSTATNKVELTCAEDVFGRSDALNVTIGETLWQPDAFHFYDGRVVLPMITISGEGAIADIVGSGGIVLPMITIAGAGSVVGIAAGSVVVPMITIAGSGSVLSGEDRITEDGEDRITEDGDFRIIQ